MRFQTLRYRGVCAVLLIGLQSVPPVAAQDAAALAAEKVKEAEAALRAAQEAYRKALLAQAAALREQAAALEAKANGAALPAAPAPAAPPSPAKPAAGVTAVAPAAPAGKIVASPSSATLENGERQKFELKLGTAAVTKDTAEYGALDPAVCASRLDVNWTADGGALTVSANKLPNGVKRLDCAVTVKTKTGAAATVSIPVSVLDEKGGEWESRAVFGFHQAGASSSDSAQNYFFDFFIMRGLGSHAKVYDSRFNIWGNVRIASSPQQIDSSVSNFVANFATKAGELKVNELAQSGEFLTGLGLKLKAWNQGDRVRMMEAVGFWGANGAFRDPGSSARVYRIPAKDTPSWPVFQRNFGQQLAAVSGMKPPEFVGFVPPDRERFYRQYGGGLRISTFELNRPYAPPATYMVTFGGDQLITEGTYKGVVARADVFYPLPIGKRDGKYQFLFLFGTANLRINKPANLDVLALEPMLKEDGKTPSVNLFDPRVLVISRPSARDTYRIGVGVDFVNLLNSWRGAR